MSGERILIVEDNEMIAIRIKAILEKLGYEAPLAVPTGEEAVEKAGELSPNLILMDIDLAGDINGIEAAIRIRERYDIPVLYLTAYSEEAVLQKAKSTGPYGYLIKPVQDRELYSSIETALFRHHMETRIKENEQWLNTTLRSIADGVITTDKEGRVNFMNRVAERLIGSTFEEAGGKRLSGLFRLTVEENGEAQETLMDDVMEEGLSAEAAYSSHLVRPDGTTVPVDFSVASIRNDADEVTGTVFVFHDITERKRAEAARKQLETRLGRAQKMEAVGTMAGGIAHDFNNILGIILGNAELALDDVPEWNPARRNLEEIRKASLRARDVIRQLLSFSRHADQHRKPVDLVQLVRETLRLLRFSVQPNIAISDILPDRPLIVNADPEQLHQILINLCANAFEAMKTKGGTLEVSLTAVSLNKADISNEPNLKPGDYVRMRFSDTGDGIPPRNLDRIFDPYFTTHDVGRGTGLGLSVVHGIVENHGGTISVESEEGKGTVFHILLPKMADGEEERGEAAEKTQGDERILLVDDDVPLAQMAGLMLERVGYRVEVRNDPEKALGRFREASAEFDLVITDMAMPVMTGDRLIQEIKEVRRDIPLILCTGYNDKLSNWQIAEMGVHQVLEKPLDREELLRTVRRVLDKAKRS